MKPFLAARLTILLIACVVAPPAMAGNFIDEQIEALETHIDHYEDIVKDGGWPAYTSRKKLTPGITHDAVATLRQILTITGDLKHTANQKRQPFWKKSKPPVHIKPDTHPENLALNFYDSRLEEAVKRFQTRHALTVDGVVGPATQRALNIPATDRLAQLLVTKTNIHQFAIAHGPLDNAVLVNIPGYQLYSLEDGKPTDQMKVIVGRKKRMTPQFSNHITYLDFNPRWYVPPKIAREDILPKIQEDPEFASRAGFKITQEGEQVDASTIDWSTIDEENFNFRLTQNAGRGNALGKVKFSIPNNKAIYLHDTSKRYLFKRGYRALSSGCVRVEHPEKLTQFVLKHGNQIDAEEAATIYAGNKLKRLTLDQPMPVHSVYWTAIAEPGTSQPSFFSDIYRIENQRIAEKIKEIEGTLSVASF